MATTFEDPRIPGMDSAILAIQRERDKLASPQGFTAHLIGGPKYGEMVPMVAPMRDISFPVMAALRARGTLLDASPADTVEVDVYERIGRSLRDHKVFYYEYAGRR